MKNLYDILEVSEKASQEVIEKAYKVLVKRYHPDLQQTPESKIKAESMIKKINDAYDILGDTVKREDYDAKLKLERQKTTNVNNAQTNNVRYTNPNGQANNIRYYNQYPPQNMNNQYQQSNNNVDYNGDMNYSNKSWQDLYNRLNYREKRKLKRKIERNAKEDYRQMYEDYFRSLGYRVRHRLTIKDVTKIIILIIVLFAIFGILWVIPPTHDWLVNLYNTNIVVRVFADLIKGIFIGIGKFFKNIFKFSF